jgi:hypothetical protein
MWGRDARDECEVAISIGSERSKQLVMPKAAVVVD